DMSGNPDLTSSNPDLRPGPDLSGCPYLYVSPAGANTAGRDGCTPANAFASISWAMTFLGVAQANQEIHVCAGTYSEDAGLSVSGGILRGGYSCTTWMQSNSYGYPGFDGINETVVQTSAASPLLQVPAAADPATIIDGFTWKG